MLLWGDENLCHLLLLDRRGEDFRKEVRAWKRMDMGGWGVGVCVCETRTVGGWGGGLMVCLDSASTGLQSSAGEEQPG